MRSSAGLLLETLGGLLLILAALVSLSSIEVDGALGFAMLAAGGVLVLYALKRPKGVLRGMCVLISAMLILGAIASGGFAMEVPNTTLVFSATRSQVPEGSMVVTANTGAGNINLTFSSDLSLAYRVTFRYPRSTGAFPSLTIVPRLSNSTSGDVFRLNLNGAGAEIQIVLGKEYSVNASLHTGAGNVVFEQPIGPRVQSLDCSTGAGNIRLVTVTASYLNCRSSAGNVEASLLVAAMNGTGSFSTSAGNIELQLRADPDTGVWLRGVTSFGSVTPPTSGGLVVLTQSATEYEGNTEDYLASANHYEVTCISEAGNVMLGFSVSG